MEEKTDLKSKDEVSSLSKRSIPLPLAADGLSHLVPKLTWWQSNLSKVCSHILFITALSMNLFLCMNEVLPMRCPLSASSENFRLRLVKNEASLWCYVLGLCECSGVIFISYKTQWQGSYGLDRGKFILSWCVFGLIDSSHLGKYRQILKNITNVRQLSR